MLSPVLGDNVLRRTLSLSAVLALVGCPAEDTDTWPDANTSNDANTDIEGDTEEGTNLEETEHCGTISGIEVWTAADNPHVVTCPIALEDADLTIEAGAEVFFSSNSLMRVSTSGLQSDLRVLGTEADPVYIGPASGPGPGKWGGIYISEFAGEIRFEHTTINGGGAGVDPSTSGNLWVDDAAITVRNLTLEDSGTVGLNLVDSARLTAVSENIVVNGSQSYPVAVDCTQAHTLPAGDSDYTGNAIDKILVDSGTVSTAVDWENLGVPYALESFVAMEGIVPAPAILTVGPGVEIQAGFNGVLMIATSGGAAGLVVNGTEAEPVRFTSEAAGVDAQWQGIEIGSAAVDNQVVFRHTTIEWGGSDPISQTNLLVLDTPILADHLTVQHGLRYGIRMSGYSGQFRSGSNALVISDTVLPIQVSASEAETLPTDLGTVFEDNLIQRVELVGNRIFFDTTWPVRDLPYQVTGNTFIAAPAGQDASLTLPPGTRLMMAWNATMIVGGVISEGRGNIIARGTSSAPVMWTAANSYTPGAWGSIILSNCDADVTVFDEFDLGFGVNGFSYTPLNPAAGQICQPTTIQNGFIHDMDKFGYRLIPIDFEEGVGMTYDNLREGTGLPSAETN
ncbi:MAG: hypothetical protein ACJAZO_002609 [Myxococcota bacterium]|jgi:hypothetical protein